MIVGATDQKLVVNVGKDITGVETAKILFIKPDGTAGEFIATVVSEAGGTLEYQLQNVNDIDMAGRWRFFAEINYFDGKVGFGRPFVIVARNPGA